MVVTIILTLLLSLGNGALDIVLLEGPLDGHAVIMRQRVRRDEHEERHDGGEEDGGVIDVGEAMDL